MCDWNQLTIEIVKELQKNSFASYSVENIFSLFKQKYPLIVIDNNIEKTKKSIEKVLSRSGHFKKTSDGTFTLIEKKNIQVSNNRKGKSKKSNNKKKKPLSQWCHQCKQKHDDIVYCCKFFNGSCTKKYCKGCIERHYHESYDNIEKDKWLCLFCRNLCVCAFCRRKRGEDVPKKVTKRKKCDMKDSSPPQKKKVKKTKKSKEKEEVVLSSPLNSPTSPTIPAIIPTENDTFKILEPSNKISQNLLNEVSHKPLNGYTSQLPLNEVTQNDFSEISQIALNSISKNPFIVESQKNIEIMNEHITKVEDSIVPMEDIESNIPINLDVSLSQLLSRQLIKVGDKLVFIQQMIYTGEILENGYIKLGWCNYVVPNIAAFTESCGFKFSIELLDNIYCNGDTLKQYIISYNQLQLPNTLQRSTETYVNVNMDNYIYFQTMNTLDSEYYDYDIPKEYQLENIFEDFDNQIYSMNGESNNFVQYTSIFV